MSLINGGVKLPTVYRPSFTRAYCGGIASDTTTAGQTKATAATYRYQIYCTASCSQLRLLFGNSVQEAVGPNDIVVKASVEDTDGNRWLVYFNGARTATVQPGGFVLSDPVGLSVAKGSFVWIRTYVTGATIWLGNVRQNTGEGTANTDEVDSGTGADTLALGYGYSPYVIYGEVPANTRCYAIIGDSVARGLLAAGASTGYDNGHMIRAMGTNYGKDVPHVQVAKNGETALTFSTPGNRKFRTGLLEGCTDAIICHGVNDLAAGAAALQTRITNIATSLQTAGINVWLATLSPVTTSSDGWTTTGNQTVGANEAARITHNTWVRTTPIGAVGYFDVADACESARNSGKWAVNIVLTTDGTHPVGEAASAQIGAAIVAAQAFPL